MEEDEANAAAEQLTRALSSGDPPGTIPLGGATPLGSAARVALPLPVSADVAVRRASTEDEEAAALEAEERLLAAQQAQLDAEAAEEASFQDASATAFQVSQKVIKQSSHWGEREPGPFHAFWFAASQKDTAGAWHAISVQSIHSVNPVSALKRKAVRLQLVLQQKAGGLGAFVMGPFSAFSAVSITLSAHYLQGGVSTLPRLQDAST